MPTANQRLFDRAVSHAHWLERYKSGVVKRLMEALNATEPDVEEQLVRRLNTILSAGGYQHGDTKERINELLRMVEKIRGQGFDQVAQDLRSEVETFARYEAEWQQSTLKEEIPVDLSVATPPANILEAAIFSRPFNGHLFKDWVDGMPAADLDRIERAIKVGVLEGKATPDIVRSIMGTASADYADGVLETTRRGAEALTRTAINHVATQARIEVAQANSDIVTGERYTATLDGRTTARCAGLDGKVFPVGKGPMTPQHWNCRSTRVPVLDGVALVADRPSVTDTRTRSEREVDFRAEAKDAAGDRWSDMDEKQRRRAIARQRESWANENIGTVPAETTYQEWLRGQSAAFQDEVLGPTKGALFRRGGLALDRFVDKSGRELTLDQLRARDGAAFSRANL